MIAPRALPVVVFALLLLTGVPSALSGGAGLPGSALHPGTATTAHPALPRAVAPPVAPAIASGAGTFFTTQSIPTPPAAQQTCFGANCVVADDNPSANLTSEGTLAVAYAAWSTQAPCAAARPSALTEIGFVTSTNGGSTWTTPRYLGNPDCSTPTVSEYPSAWEPTLSSLGNGTLVLAFIEYNVTSGAQPPNIEIGGATPQVTYDRLVVTRSFDNGTTWTSPLVLNTSANPSLSAVSFAPQRPWIDAVGDTVYVAWENYSARPTSSGTGSSAIHLVVSTDGGATFGAPIGLSTIASGTTSVALNPSLAIDPTGRLYVAYASNFTYLSTVGCPSSGCIFGGWSASVVVAATTNNGSSFSYSSVPGSVIVAPARWSPFLDPSPTLALSPSGAQVIVGFSNGLVENLCYKFGCFVGYGTEVQVANSSNNGATFSAPHVAIPSLLGGTNYGGNQQYDPAIAVTSDGVVHLAEASVNYSVCAQGFYGLFCGPQAELYTTSTNNGSSFGAPLFVSDNSTQLLLNPNNPDGEYATMIAAGSALYLAWTSDTCGVWNGSLVYNLCTWPGTGGSTAVQVSELFQGTGFTLTFSETGLATGTDWTVNVLGNVRNGIAPTSLVLTGVPKGENLTWNVSVATPYGYRYSANFSIANPYILPATTTVAVTFTSQVLLNVDTVPNLPPYPYGTPYCNAGFFWNVAACPGINWNITPNPGPQWVTAGSVVSLDAYPNPVLYCGAGSFCYSTDILNLSFLSWTGSGSQSVNTTSNATSVTVNGPVNETANFALNGYCYYQYPAYGAFYTCVGPNVTYAFQEVGLPNGTMWGVTLSSGTTFQSSTSTTPFDTFTGHLNSSLVNYTAWTLNSGTAGKLWIPSGTPVSPISLPADPLVTINYTLESASAATFPIYLTAVGLPSATSWSATVDTVSYGAQSTNMPALTVSGGSHTLSAAQVVLSNATRYEPNAIDARQINSSGTWANTTTLPANLFVDGTTYAYVTYSVQYLLTTSVSGCGSVSSTGGWYNVGTGVTLQATPNAGCYFVGWTGSGAGGVTGTGSSILVAVDGPVTELATFAALPPPTWTVNVTESGLPAGVAYSVGIGNLIYTGSGAFAVHGLATGDYAIATPYAYLNGSEGTRYVPSIASTSFAMTGGEIDVLSSGWLNLSFATQYLINVTAGPGGTATPLGLAWVDGGTSLLLTATPAAGMMFVGWSASGIGGATSTQASFSLSVVGPAVETASFISLPTPPTTLYAVTITASGLPAGTDWSAQVGASGYASTTTSLTVMLPNGTYPLSAGTIAGATGERFVPTVANPTVTVAGAAAGGTVAYGTEYYLTVISGIGGSVNVTSGWYPSGSVVLIGATPSNSSEQFSSWNATGAGTTTTSGSGISVTLSGAETVTATFAPVLPAPQQPSSAPPSNNGLYIGLGLLVALLAVGIVVGAMLRRRPPRAAAEPTPEPSSDTYGSAAPAEESPPSG